MQDRDYYFWIATFTRIPGCTVDPIQTAEELLTRARRTVPLIAFSGYEIYRDVGDVSMQTDTAPVRPWEYCLLAELDSRTDIERLLAEPPVVMTGLQWSERVQCLSSEITTRPEGSGTALPRALPGNSALPPNFRVALEYIDIPEQYWSAYQAFMRDAFGPVGRWLVERGHSHKIIITERVRSFFHDASMPPWNRIHALTGDFDSAHGGFIEHTTNAASAIMGRTHTLSSAMAPINHYRRKRKMSKNELVYSSWPPGEK